MWFKLRRPDWDAAGRAGRKAMFKALVDRGPAPGVLAYVEEAPVGWCAVEPRAAYPVIGRSRIRAPIDDRPAHAITCFYLRPRWRRRGLMRPLIEGAVAAGPCARCRAGRGLSARSRPGRAPERRLHRHRQGISRLRLRRGGATLEGPLNHATRGRRRGDVRLSPAAGRSCSESAWNRGPARVLRPACTQYSFTIRAPATVGTELKNCCRPRNSPATRLRQFTVMWRSRAAAGACGPRQPRAGRVVPSGVARGRRVP